MTTTQQLFPNVPIHVYQEPNEFTDCYMYANKILSKLLKELESKSEEELIECAKKYKGVVNMMKDIVNTFTKVKKTLIWERREEVESERMRLEFFGNIASVKETIKEMRENYHL